VFERCDGCWICPTAVAVTSHDRAEIVTAQRSEQKSGGSPGRVPSLLKGDRLGGLNGALAASRIATTAELLKRPPGFWMGDEAAARSGPARVDPGARIHAIAMARLMRRVSVILPSVLRHRRGGADRLGCCAPLSLSAQTGSPSDPRRSCAATRRQVSAVCRPKRTAAIRREQKHQPPLQGTATLPRFVNAELSAGSVAYLVVLKVGSVVETAARRSKQR
jgi:hypothetical protein